MAIAAAVIAVVGAVVSAVNESNALRAQAAARKIEGEQELELNKRQLRRELGQQVVSVGASGLLGGSFAEVFDTQAIEDSRFLGIIVQRANQDISNLRAQARNALISGGFGAASSAFGGASSARSQNQQVRTAEAQRRSVLRANRGSRLRPSAQPFFGPNRTRSRENTFSAGVGQVF